MTENDHQSPNSTRIQSMLDDLTQQRGDAGTPPSAGTLQGAVPGNLPTGSGPQHPVASNQTYPAPRPGVPFTQQQPSPARQVPPPVPPQQKPAPSPANTAVPVKPPAPTELAPPPRPTPAPPPRPPVPPQQKPAPSPANTAVPVKPPAPTEPQKPRTPQTSTTEVRTMTSDVQRIRTGQAPSAVPGTAPVEPSETPQGPTVPAPPSPTMRPAGGIVVPQETSSGFGKKIAYIIGILALFGILVIGGYALFSGEAKPSPTPTRTPTTSPTPTPARQKDLSFYFGQLAGTLRLTTTEPTRQDIRNALTPYVPVNAGQVRNVEAQGIALFPSVLSTLSNEDLGIEGAVLVFAQGELFDGNGMRLTEVNPQPRLIFVSEVTDGTAVRNAITAWESNLTERDEILFDIEITNASVAVFSDGEYRGIPIRYQNYPYADRSIDWAIIPASNRKNYLIISGSREGMFFTVDQLLK